MNDIKPKLMGGIGEINFGKQYRQWNRIYDAAAIAMCVLAQPVGNTGGYSYLYLVKRHNQERNHEKKGKIKEIIMNQYTKLIDNCLDCDCCSVRPIYTADSWEHEEGAYCKEVIENGKEKLIVADDWDLRKYSKIPDWCPKLIKSRLNELRIKAGIGSNKKFDEKLNGLLKDQSEEYSKLIRTLISMGFAYEQVVFERDVAIQQLNELGIQFGEDIQKYKVVKS